MIHKSTSSITNLIHSKIIKISSAFLTIIFVSGCSLTLPLSGAVQNSKEKFSGTATGYWDRSGDLKIITTTGAKCAGAFVYVTFRTGEGVFNCDDGRTGPFTFVSTGRRGTGSGNLGDKNFTFIFGE